MISRGLSFISETNVIQCWLDTPLGYYNHLPDFGNTISDLVFKNSDEAVILLDSIVDAIGDSLGSEVASEIINIRLVSTEDRESFYVIIDLSDGSVAYREVE